MNLSKLFQNSIKLQRCTGLNPEQFGRLAERVKPLWELSERERLTRPNRKRNIGAGHSYHLKSIEEKLFTLLLWYKLYPSFWFLGLIVGLDAANVQKLTAKLRPLIEFAADPDLSLYLTKAREKAESFSKGKKISSWKDLKAALPEIAEILIDATEQERQRPKERIQKVYRSGKRRRHTLKTQIAVGSNGQILNVSQTYPGSVHDLTVLRAEGTVKKMPRLSRFYLDRGYQGVGKDYPDLKFKIPPKRNRWQKELTRSQKIQGTKISRKRILVEHVLSRLKKYGLLAGKIRHGIRGYNQDFRNLAALTNFRLAYRTI